MAALGSITKLLFKYALPKIGGKVVKKLITNIIKNWTKTKVNELKDEVDNVVINVDNLKRTLTKVPPINAEDSSTDNVVTNKKDGITNDVVNFVSELEIEPTSDDTHKAGRELDSQSGDNTTRGNENNDDTILMAMLGGLVGSTLTANIIRNKEKFSLKNFDFNFKGLDTDKYKERLADKIKTTITPDSSQVKTGEATGEYVTVLTKSKDFGDKEVKNVYAPNKAVIKRQGVGFQYKDDEIDSAKYDNPLNVNNDITIKQIGGVGVGMAGYTNIESRKLGFYRNVTGDENAVFTDPYYSFVTVAQVIYNLQNTQYSDKSLRGWIVATKGKTFETFLKRKGMYDSENKNYNYLIDRYAQKIGNLMNQLGISQKLQSTKDKLDILDVNTYIAFLKVMAYIESGLDVSTRYLLACYNAQFYGMAKPLQIEGANWGEDTIGLLEDAPFESNKIIINQQAAAARQKLDWSILIKNEP